MDFLRLKNQRENNIPSRTKRQFRIPIRYTELLHYPIFCHKNLNQHVLLKGYVTMSSLLWCLCKKICLIQFIKWFYSKKKNQKNNLKQIKDGFPGGWVVKNPPANTGDMGSILGWEDPVEEEMAAHTSTLAWQIPWTEEPGRGHKRISIYRAEGETKEIQSHFTPELPKMVATAPIRLF